MESLLSHMVNLSAHRDHALLDLALVAAAQELAGASDVVLLAVASAGGQQVVQPRAQAGADGALRGAAAADADAPTQPLAALPALRQCLARHGASAESAAADGVRTLWLPIWSGDRAAACLQVARPAPFDAATIAVLDALARVYRNFRLLLDYSERDSLTGLLNRKTFDDQLAKMLQAAAGQKAPLPGEQERRQFDGDARQWLAVIDVDHFKLVNDRFGHVYGDEVLILIANLLQTSFRAYDRVFRFGGEEFVVLLRSTTLENARKVIDRFRNNVATHVFPQVGAVTVSVGFVSISAQDAPIVILGHADQALYYAKSHGRNQACHYDQLLADGLLATVASNDTAEFF